MGRTPSTEKDALPKAALRRPLKPPEGRWRGFVRFWHRWLLPSLLGLLVAAATSLVMPFGFFFQALPDLKEEDVGRPFQGAVPFKVAGDVEVVDEVGTRAKRERMRNQEPVVFDYNALTQETVKRNTQEGFKSMRAFLASEKGAAKPKGGKAAKQGEAERQAWLEGVKARFLQSFFAQEDEDFEALVADKFSESAEKAVQLLIDRAYGSRLLTSREGLGASDIRVRNLNELGEHVLRAIPPEVMDLQEVQAELDRFASIPGNLMPEASPIMRRAVLRLAKRELRADLMLNQTKTEERRAAAYASVAPLVVFLRKGQKIIGDGELITHAHLEWMKALKRQTDSEEALKRHLGSFATVWLFLLACFVFFRAALLRFQPSSKDLSFLATLLLGMVGALFLWRVISEALNERYPLLPLQALQALFPLATGAALVRFVLNEEAALFIAILFSAIAGMMFGDSLSFTLASLAVSCIASASIARAQDRKGIFRAGFMSGVLAFFVMFFWAVLEGKSLWEGLAAGCCAMLGLSFGLPALVMGLTPIMEAVFGYASDLKLLELANLNHPALKELIVRAPGTYHHSIIMGSLVEAAAQAISANPLLARSCAYYHDIGKGKQPGYFAENQEGKSNPHDALSPLESAAILRQHIIDGLELAKQHKLPKRVMDAIPQHHGTRRMGYFFHKATAEAGEGVQVDEGAFRYRGPKPQFREAALVMLADATEAAARSLPSTTPEELKKLVLKMVNLVFSEGQLDECDLTLRDLNKVVDAFVVALNGIYHARPQYPADAFKTGKPETA
ncbi:MAG: HDIG domain-containing protein, partial [Cystobacterineae bacterium]|nr:HDIG domain-containing protein [Cystobacterineae bacterium]